MRKLHQSTMWWTPKSQRSSASTGARVSPGKFSPTSPKGGFGSSVYEAARYIDEQYGYNSEAYYKSRLFGNSPDDIRWRYDLNKHLIGRDYHKSSNVSFTWQPRFPKKKYKTSYKQFHKKAVPSRRQFCRWVYSRPNRTWRRQCSSRPDYRYRRRSSYRGYY